MNEFRFVDIPDEYALLLRSDMSSSGKYHIGLQSYILKSPSLKGILNRILSRGVEININSHIKTLGWHGVRDRILCYYVHFAQTKKHLEKVNLDLIEDLVLLEKNLRFSTVSGYSRLILLGFYIFLDCVEEGIDNIQEHPLYPNADIIDVLKLTNERTIYIDQLIILTHHLISFFGKETLIKYIEDSCTYEALYHKMTEDQREIVCRNFMTYSASINEQSIFTEKMV